MAKKLNTNERRLAAHMCACWEAETEIQNHLTLLAETQKGKERSRTLVNSAVAQTHASRLLGRMAAWSLKLLPVPRMDTVGDLNTVLGLSSNLISKYNKFYVLARKENDPASAWILELNCAELEDMYAELKKTKKKKAEQAA